MSEMLSPVEQQVARCALKRFSHQQTARRLSLSESTVRENLHTLYAKLGISSPLELYLCVCSGVVDLGEGRNRKVA
jgi:DNA-binding NarL/FixJ family response regulator